MSLTNSYLNTTKNFESIMNSILNAKAPERFTNKFLEDLGFKSSNDRLIIGVLKSLGLLDDMGQPTQRYFDFLDQSQSKKVIAIGIQEAYEDLFNLRKDAQNLSNDEVKNKLKTITQGQKSDKVLGCMVLTFRTLCDYADWDIIKHPQNKESINDSDSEMKKSGPSKKITETASFNDTSHQNKSNNEMPMELHYNIQIHLPETTNMAVYDAIFQSLKKHLF